MTSGLPRATKAGARNRRYIIGFEDALSEIWLYVRGASRFNFFRNQIDYHEDKRDTGHAHC